MLPLVTGFMLFLAVVGNAAGQSEPSAPIASSQQSPQSSNLPTPALTVNAHLVLLDVVVTDKNGHSVQGLKQSDFQLSENGVPQTIASFKEHNSVSTFPIVQLPLNTFANHAPVTDGRAMTVLLFDELSPNNAASTFMDAAYARHQVAAFTKTLSPGTPLCIFRLDGYGLHLVQDFTTDPELIDEAVESKRNAQGLRLPGLTALSGRRAVAMHELARYLAAFPGRKNLIWFGTAPEIFTGRPGSPFPDVSTFTDDTNGVTDTLTLSRVVLYPVDTRGLVMSPGEGLEIMIEGHDLSDMASATGGKAFYTTNGIKEAVAEAIATGSNYYTVSYRPTNALWNGDFRKIKVKLANGVWDEGPNQQNSFRPVPPLRLEYRSGYFARDNAPINTSTPRNTDSRKLLSYSPKGDPNLRAARKTPLQIAMSFGAVAPFQILFRAQITPSPNIEKIDRTTRSAKGTYLKDPWQHRPYRNYTIHYSVDPKGIQFASEEIASYHATIEFIAVVYDDNGEVINSVVNSMPFEVNAEGFGQIMRGGVGIDQTIAIPLNGNFFLRLGVHDLVSERIGALEVPVEAIKLQPSQK